MALGKSIIPRMKANHRARSAPAHACWVNDICSAMHAAAKRNFHLTIRTRVTMKRYVYSLGAVMLLSCCMPALAQGYYVGPAPGPDYTPVNWYFAGGYTAATGE